MSDEQFEDLVDKMSQQHNPPPETPSDRMWERIDAERREIRQVVRPRFGRPVGLGSGFWRLAAAAVAVLAIGIAVGRVLPRNGGRPTPQAEAPGQLAPGKGGPVQGGPEAMIAGTETGPTPAADRSGPAGRLLYNQVAANLFGRAAALLTDIRTTSCADNDLDPVPGWLGLR